MSVLDVRCPQCQRSISAADVNIVNMVAKCSECDVVFTIDSLAVPAAVSSVVSTHSETAPSRPSGITEQEGSMGERVIRLRWFHAALFGLLFFCVAWDAFLVFWYSMALFGMGKQGHIEWIAVVFPIAHVAVGVSLTYYVVAGFLNSTWITIDSESLSIRHAPVPWRGNRQLMKEEIREIELEFGSFQPKNGGPTMTISAHHTDGRQIVLLTGLETQKAEYLAWHMANSLQVPLNRKNHSMMGVAPLPAFLQRFLPRK